MEIWINDAGEVFRLEESVRPWGVSDEIISRYYNGPWFDLKKTEMLVERKDFVTDATGNVRYPRLVEVTYYRITAECQRYLMEGRQKDAPEDYQVKRLLFDNVPASRFLIISNIVRINEPLPGEIFHLSLPENSWVASTPDNSRMYQVRYPQKWYVRWRFAVLLAACCVITLAIGWAGVRWLGWRS
ncbi:MAG TPA: hypothetical protein PK349_00340 [Candidatus Hydrogenedentes bacterium]|nr:hypothetical protein [Candidatus Hydrogenedentota bacterium]